MPLPVVTVASGGLPINWVSALPFALPIVEASAGIPVTKVTGGGLPATYVTAAGAIVSPLTPTTWNPADRFNAVLSNGNLTATSAGFANFTRSVASKSTGKFYWETTIDVITNPSTGTGITLGATAVDPPHLLYVDQSGGIYRLATGMGSVGAALSAGKIIGVALDLGAGNIWFRICPANNWNNSGPANPATNTGGVDLGTWVGSPVFPTVYFNASGDKTTANFGAAAFSGVVPSGFTPGFG